MIGEARIYNQSLSQQQILVDMNAQAFGLAAYWNFDEGSGTAAYDSSGNNNTLTLYGPTWVDGVSGKALSFNGIDEYGEETGTSLMNQLPLTLSAWVRPELRTDGTDFPNNVISNDNPGYYGNGFGVNVWSGGSQMKVECQDAWRIVPGVSFNAGLWYYVTVVYTSGNVQSYVNGALVDSFNYTQASFTGDNIIRIGKHNDDVGYGTARFFKGTIDDVGIYNVALSQQEIQSAMNSVNVPGLAIQSEISPLNASTSIGGSLNYGVTVSNQGYSLYDVNLSVSGLDESWYSLENNQMPIAPGELSTIQLNVTVPDNPENVGLYAFNVTVTDPYKQNVLSANLTVLMNPIMYDLEPNSNTTIGATSFIVSWKTSSNASSEVYIECLNDSTSSLATGTWGTDHSVYIGNLSRNNAYTWYAQSATDYGQVDSDNMSLNVSNGVSFSQSVYTFNVQRDYDQQASISINNTDTQSHDVLLQAINPYDDLIVGFVGPGSTDENLTLGPGETASVAFNIFAQDAMQQNYTLTIDLTNLGPEQITDYALVNVNVRQPNLNLTLTEDSIDPVTLTKTITATNYGDTITDLSIGTSNDLVGDVSFEPTVCHDDLPTGGSLTFQVTPVLATDFTSIEGNITATGAGQVIATLPVNFTLPTGENVYSATIPQMSIQFDSYYDNDDSPNTNPLPSQPVESYLANGTIIFASQIIVDVFQNGVPASGANVSLTVWDSTGAVASLDYSVTDFTGKALFNVVGPAGNYSYQAELVDYGIETETRSFSVSPGYLYEIRPNDISWLDVSDGISTYNLTENLSNVTLTQAPFTFRAATATTGENATFALVLRWDLDVFKDVYILGTIQNNTLTFQTSGIPPGNFTAIVVYYSPDTGLSVSPAINVTNTDSTSMYNQGNYTYYTPFPFSSTYFIRLITERSVSARDPDVAFDLMNIEPSDATNSLYQLEYEIVSNESIQENFQFYVNTTEGVLYNSTMRLNLEPSTPVEVNFTIPVELPNGTLQGEFDATLSTNSSSVTTMTTPQLSYIYDSRIWVGSSLGILDPFTSASARLKSHPAALAALVTCGAFTIVGELGPEVTGIAESWVEDSYGLMTGADNVGDQLIITAEYVGAAIALVTGTGEAAVAAAGTVLLIGGITQCAYDTYRAAAETAKGSTGCSETVGATTSMSYCTNRPVVSAQVSIDPPSVDVVQAVAVVEFSLPWPMEDYRAHNVHLFINGVEIGNLTDTIPDGYYIFPFNSLLLNYAPDSPSDNTITMKMDNLNGGHYVVTSNWEIILQLKQITLSVVASNETEAESLVAQLSGTVVSMPDFSISPNLSLSTPQPKEGQTITITANVLNLGYAGMSYVPVDLYVDSTKVESAIISFLPAFANQTIDFVWMAARGTHSIVIVVNGAEELPESDYSNNQAQTSITVFADDVAIANVAAAKNVVGQGFLFNATVTAANDGDFTETFNVTAYANTTTIASQNVTLASGTSTTLTLTWNTTGLAYGNYTISAYAWPAPGEIDTANNNCTGGWVIVSIVGDTTGPKGIPDGKVDMRDIAVVARAFGSDGPNYLYPGSSASSNWNPNADINNDGTVNMRDVALAARHFGQHYP